MTWPDACACCGDPSATTIDARRGPFSTAKHRVPVCAPCAAHAAAWTTGTKHATELGAGVYLASMLAYGLTTSPFAAVGFVFALPFVSVQLRRANRAAASLRGPRCTCDGPPVVVLRGSALGFTSEPYAVAVALANRAALQAAPDIVRARLEPPRAIVVERGRVTE